MSFYDSVNHGRSLDTAWHRHIRNIIQSHYPVSFLDVGAGEGIDIDCEYKHAIEISSQYHDSLRKKGYDIIPDAGYATRYDVIFMGDVLEHIFDTDAILTELRRKLNSEGVLIITTPNLASWYNRISLLLGYQPINAEVSAVRNAGHIVRLEGQVAGHIRCMTGRALCELVERNGYEIVSREGWMLPFSMSTKLILTAKAI